MCMCLMQELNLILLFLYAEGPLLMPPLGEEKWSHYQELLQSIKIEVLTFGAVLYPHLVKDSSIPQVVQDKMCSK